MHTSIAPWSFPPPPRTLATLLLSVVLFSTPGLSALELSPTATISLITEDPGREVYLAFGHSALRVKDPKLGLDVLFNYGTIDERYLTDPSFVPRFVAGDLRYSLGVSRFRDAVVYDKKYEDRHWYEQVLNLNPEQVNQVFAALEWNAREENAGYLYDFVADNCATRIPAILEKALGPVIHWGKRSSTTTAQGLVGEYLKERPLWKWWSFLAIGSVVYQPLDDRTVLFIPDELQRAAREATIDVAGVSQPLVSLERRVVEGAERGTYDEPGTSPAPWLWGLLILVAAASFWPRRPGPVWLQALGRWGDGVYFGLIGLGGSILVFLTFFSIHTATHGNLNLVWLTPLAWVAAFVAVRKQPRRWHRVVWVGVLVLNTAPLLVGWWGPQPLALEHLPLLGLALIRAAARLKVSYQRLLLPE